MQSVLIVDDSLILRQKLKFFLTDLGYDVVGASSSAEDSIGLAKRLKPDIITMDINMGEMTGVEATRHLTKNNPDLKIIMITTEGQESIVLSAIVAGAKGYLLKPIEKDKLNKILIHVNKDH